MTWRVKIKDRKHTDKEGFYTTVMQIIHKRNNKTKIENFDSDAFWTNP